MSDLFDLPFEEEPPEPAPEPPAPSARSRRVFTVTELTVRVRDLLEAEFVEIWVEGELSNCRVWNTGHLYFTLKDGSSQVRGVIFRTALRYLKFRPADGVTVVAATKYIPLEDMSVLAAAGIEDQLVDERDFGMEHLKFLFLRRIDCA